MKSEHHSRNNLSGNAHPIPSIEKLSYNRFEYKSKKTFAVDNIGDHHVPVVIADLSHLTSITVNDLKLIGYTYDESSINGIFLIQLQIMFLPDITY